METKFSLCQRSPTIPATANNGNDHDRLDRIRESISATIVIVSDRQRSQKFNGNHQCSDCSDRNDPSDHMEIIA